MNENDDTETGKSETISERIRQNCDKNVKKFRNNVIVKKQIKKQDMTSQLDLATNDDEKERKSENAYIETINGVTIDLLKYENNRRHLTYHCDWTQCNYKNKIRINFKGHIYQHYGLYPFKCDHCGHSFVTKTPL